MANLVLRVWVCICAYFYFSSELSAKTISDEIWKSKLSTAVAISVLEGELPAQAFYANSLTADQFAEKFRHFTGACGTGVFIESSGYILTNEHVVKEASEKGHQLWVTDSGGHVIPALVIASDAKSDLALIKTVEKEGGYDVAEIATTPAKVGDQVFAFGNPRCESTRGNLKMAAGEILNLSGSLPKLSKDNGHRYSKLMTTDAEIYPGFSGGPVFDSEGGIVAISVSTITLEKDVSGNITRLPRAFNIPLNADVVERIQSLRSGQAPDWPWIGVAASSTWVEKRLATKFHLEKGSDAVFIEEVSPGSPAEGQLLPGDLIVRLNGERIESSEQWVEEIGNASLQKLAVVDFVRGSELKSVQIQLKNRPYRGMNLSEQMLSWNGFTFKQTTDGVLANDGTKKIRSLSGHPIESLEDFLNLAHRIPFEQIQIDFEDSQRRLQNPMLANTSF